MTQKNVENEINLTLILQPTIYRQKFQSSHKTKKNSTRRRHHTYLDDQKVTNRNNEVPIIRRGYTKMIEICYKNTTFQDPNDSRSYWLVVQTNILSKIFKRLKNKILVWYLVSKKRMDSLALKNRNTMDVITKIKNSLMGSKKKRRNRLQFFSTLRKPITKSTEIEHLNN